MKKQYAGFSYVELLIATLLITIILIPALEAMQSGILGSGLHTELARDQSAISEKMEQTLARPFDQLLIQADLVGDPTVLIPEPFSDSAGTQPRRLVFLSRYDGDNADSDNNPFTGIDTGLIWVRVAIENRVQSLETLVSE